VIWHNDVGAPQTWAHFAGADDDVEPTNMPTKGRMAPVLCSANAQARTRSCRVRPDFSVFFYRSDWSSRRKCRRRSKSSSKVSRKAQADGKVKFGL